MERARSWRRSGRTRPGSCACGCGWRMAGRSRMPMPASCRRREAGARRDSCRGSAWATLGRLRSAGPHLRGDDLLRVRGERCARALCGADTPPAGGASGDRAGAAGGAVAVRQADPHLAPSTAELHERLFVEARRYSEKVNVVDHVEDRTAFVSSGAIPPARPSCASICKPASEPRVPCAKSCGRSAQSSARIAAAGQERSAGERRVALRVLRLIEDVRSRLPQAVQRERSDRSRSRVDYDR